jgi:hypothetical protein
MIDDPDTILVLNLFQIFISYFKSHQIYFVELTVFLIQQSLHLMKSLKNKRSREIKLKMKKRKYTFSMVANTPFPRALSTSSYKNQKKSFRKKYFNCGI